MSRLSTDTTLDTTSSQAAVSNGRLPTSARTRPQDTRQLKLIPTCRDLRDQIRQACHDAVSKRGREYPPCDGAIGRLARRLLHELLQPEGYIGWTMVMLANEFWRDQVAATAMSRRILLLPPYLEHVKGCHEQPSGSARVDNATARCGACSVARLREVAERLGYRVLVAERSSAVMNAVVGGQADALIGIATLDMLEAAFDKILLAGIPCTAIPLEYSDGDCLALDEDWAIDLICRHHESTRATTRTFLHLIRLANIMFSTNELERLAPRQRGGPRLAEANGDGLGALDPIAATEAIAYDFLSKGGKHSRPFITLSTYDALSGARCTGSDGAAHANRLPDEVRRTAMSIETFHKASLVHDDIEDDDTYRYGDPTIHRMHGVPTAINVGDYLIGMGYRLISRDAATLGADVAADIIDYLADAHLRLSEGQGAELAWRDAHNKRLTTHDALNIYALKTAPAFEAAMYSGVRLAGNADAYVDDIKQLARHIGIAFQILNDLKDWQGDHDNKLSIGGDVLGGRPTVLLAMALQSLDSADQTELLDIVASPHTHPAGLSRVQSLYQRAGVFEKAIELIEQHQCEAETVARRLWPDPLNHLAHYLIDTILQRPAEFVPVGTNPQSEA